MFAWFYCIAVLCSVPLSHGAPAVALPCPSGRCHSGYLGLQKPDSNGIINSCIPTFGTCDRKNKTHECCRGHSCLATGSPAGAPDSCQPIGEADGDERQMFYWLFPATQVDPATAPLLVWLQGGPGASSLLGLFFENGPLSLQEDSNGEIIVSNNPSAWNSQANLVYLDQPFGTGFSFANASQYITSEQGMPEVAIWLRLALLELAKVQPQFASSVLANANGGDARKLWLSGESYAGKYVPYLATEIGTYEDPLSQSLLAGGLAIGDGWVDPPIIVASYPLFAYSHGLVDYPQRIAMEKNVSLFQAALAQQKFELATEIEHGIEHFVEDVAGVNAYDIRHIGSYNFSIAEVYLNDDKVRAALGVVTGPDAPLFQISNSAVNDKLKGDISKSGVGVMSHLLDTYRVLLYNGAMDMDCNILGTLDWLHTVPWRGQSEFNTTSSGRQQWTANGGVAGWSRTVHNFTQLVINNAGHMVPMNQPEVSLAMINTLLSGKPFV